jgi:hypothetical protein
MQEEPNVKSNLKYVDPEGKWLYEAALSAASRLPLIDLSLGPLERQLVLVRYSGQVESKGFPRSLRWAHGAMWTDVVTGRSPKTAKITGADREANWLAMNVIRIGLPVGFAVPCERAGGDGPIRCGRTQLGTEYWLDHDVNVLQFATIPFEFISSSRHFAQMGPTNLHFADGSWLPPL